MTATPIPRSLALALYGDLDISIINEMPIGRKKIITNIIPETKRAAAYQFIREQIKAGRQIFVICPLIDPSDKLGVKSVREEFEKLDKQIFPEIKMGMLHGRLKSKEKENIMQEFLENKIKILVSTSVVEVGLDVPNATTIMIEGAERFGLAQLHQFRGRVGRSEHQSYCFLFTDNESEKTAKRLNALVNCYDGFALAKMDLKFRGPGEVYGLEQAGFPELSIASLFDYALMKETQTNAIKLIEKDQTLNSWPDLKNKLGILAKKAHLE
jgi:ATP-dependent DNA helicase RecG